MVEKQKAFRIERLFQLSIALVLDLALALSLSRPRLFLRLKCFEGRKRRAVIVYLRINVMKIKKNTERKLQ